MIVSTVTPRLLALGAPWPFDRTYMQLALLAGLMVGACAPLIGAFLVQKRMSLMGDGIGHLAFAGVAGGLVLGVWPIWTALGASVLGALLVEWLRSRSPESGDLALAALFYGGIALGIVLIGRAGGINANINTYLFGGILNVSPTDAWVVAIVCLCVIATIALCGRALFAVVLDEDAARVAGLPVAGLNAVLSALTALVVVASMRIVGILLVSALMVLPVGVGQRIARSFRAMVLTASAVGMLSVVAGLVIARAARLAAGGTIVLVALGAFVLASLRPRR